MKRFILGLSLIIASVGVHAEKMHSAGSVTGDEYNSLMDKLYPRTINVFVSWDQLQVTTNSSMGGTFVDFGADVPARAKEFSDMIAKAMEWSKVAKENNADVRKEVGSIVDRGEVNFVFSSTNAGKYTYLIIEIKDWDNQFKKSRVIVDDMQMAELKAVFDNGIAAALAKAEEEKKNQVLFN